MNGTNTTNNSGKHGASLLSQMERSNTVRAIYEKYNTGLIKYLTKRLRSREDVEDVAQEVYVRLIKYTNLDGLEPSLPLMCTIASNLIKDNVRKQRVKSTYRHVSLDNEIKSKAASPEEIIMSKDGVNKFKRIFRSLNNDFQKVFTLHRLEGYTYEEISQKMGISKSMAYKHMKNAMLALMSEFERET